MEVLKRWIAGIGGAVGAKPKKDNRRPAPKASPHNLPPVDSVPPDYDGTPRYPTYLKGLPCVPPDQLLEHHEDLVKQITYFCDIEKEQPGLVRFTLENYAAAVHLVPASESHHHAGHGGLLRHGLEVARSALMRLNEFAPFANDTYAEERRHLQPRMRYAVLSAALGHDLGKPVTDMSITDMSGKKKWNPMSETLYEWAKREDVDRYFLHWRAARHNKHEPVSVLMVGFIMGRAGRSYLNEIESNLLSDCVEAVAGEASVLNIIAKVVKQADQDSTERDQKRRGGAQDPGGSIPLETYYLDAMRALVRQKRWTFNKPGARVWQIQGQVYIVWPTGGQEMQSYFQERNIQGIPTDPGTILNELGDRGVLRKRTDSKGNMRSIWPILPDKLKKSLTSPLRAIRLEDPDLLFDSDRPSAEGVVGEEAEAFYEESESAEGGDEAEQPASAEKKKATKPKAAKQAPSEPPPETEPEEAPGAPSDEEAAGPEAAAEPETQAPQAERQPPRDEAARKPTTAKQSQPNQGRGKPASGGQVKRDGEEKRGELTPDQCRSEFQSDGLLGVTILSMIDDLNKFDPETQLVKTQKAKIGGEDAMTLLLAVPDFFAPYHNIPDQMEQMARESDLIHVSESGEMRVEVDGRTWWRLRPAPTMWAIQLLKPFIARRNRSDQAAEKRRVEQDREQQGEAPPDVDRGEVKRADKAGRPSEAQEKAGQAESAGDKAKQAEENKVDRLPADAAIRLVVADMRSGNETEIPLDELVKRVREKTPETFTASIARRTIRITQGASIQERDGEAMFVIEEEN